MTEPRSYPLPTETMPGLTLSQHLDDLVEIRDFFGSRGIETRNTRIERYSHYLDQASSRGPEAADATKIFKNSVGPPFLSPGDWFLYVLREVHELTWIYRGLKEHLPRGVDDKLRAIAAGRDFAALDIDSQSRNTQFELRIASYFCQAGCEVDLSTDTDIIASTNKHAFYLECKRVANKNQLGKRLSEARTQLGRRMPRKDGRRLVLGCIAVDVTKVAFSHNGLTFGLTNDHSRDMLQEKLVEIASSVDHLLTFDSCRKLLCYWMQIHISTLIMRPAPATRASRFSSYHIPRLRLTPKEARALTAFYAVYEFASRVKDHRALPPKPLTQKTEYRFPAGSEFDLDSDRLLKLLEKSEVTQDELAEVIGTLTIDGTDHEFIFLEIRMFPAEAIAEWRSELSNDQRRANFLLICALYARRYPYEESEQLLKPV